MSVVSALRRYMQILGALLRREEESRRQTPMESIVSLLEPIFLIAMLSFLFWFLNRRQGSPLGGAPVLYYATGFFPLYFFIYISRQMRGSIDTPNQRLPIEQRLDHIIVHIILRIIDYAILGLILFGGIYLFFSTEAMPNDLTKVLAACAGIVGLGFGWGVLHLVLSQSSRFWGFVFPSISRVLIMFSGVFFLPDLLLPETRYVLSFNPMLHAVQLFRIGFYPQYPAITLDTHYLAYSAVLFLFFGLVVERISRRFEGK